MKIRRKKVKDFDYRVTEDGRVYRIKENGEISDEPLKPVTTHQGHLEVMLWRDNEQYPRYVHNLVAETFISDRPEGTDVVNHIDGDMNNNHVDNLEYATYSMNNQHAYDKGLNNGPTGVRAESFKSQINKIFS